MSEDGKDLRETSALTRWLACVSRGHHDFDDFGVCIDCYAERGGPSLADVARSEANRRSGRTT